MIERVTIACVYKIGGDFTREYVHRLADGVRAHAARPHRFVCLTDSDEQFDCETIPLTDGLPGWWSKLELFKTYWGRTVYFDLDTVIVGSLDPLLDYDGPIALLPNFYSVKLLLSTGIMAWNAPLGFIYPSEAEKAIILQNPRAMDQYFIVDKLERAKFHVDIVSEVISMASYKEQWRKRTAPDDTRIVYFHGKPRPHEIGWRV